MLPIKTNEINYTDLDTIVRIFYPDCSCGLHDYEDYYSTRDPRLHKYIRPNRDEEQDFVVIKYPKGIFIYLS